MKISIVVDNARSWFLPFVDKLGDQLRVFGDVNLLPSADDIPEGNEIAFLLSCEKKVGAEVLRRSRCNVVVHASELPKGKGMSPLTWQVLEGRNTIPLTLFEAVEEIDAGPVYLRDQIVLKGNELLDEMRAALGAKIVEMCVAFAGQWPSVLNMGVPQAGDPTYYRRRLPEDSRLDPHKSISDQFNLLRVSDNERYPAFFEWLGRRYSIKIETAE